MTELIKIGILNCETGKERIVKELQKELFEEDKSFLKRVMETGKKISRWFDRQDTFFSGKEIWNYWERVGTLTKFEVLARGSRLSNVAAESIIVFNGKGNRGVEYQFFMERVEANKE